MDEQTLTLLIAIIGVGGTLLASLFGNIFQWQMLHRQVKEQERRDKIDRLNEIQFNIISAYAELAAIASTMSMMELHKSTDYKTSETDNIDDSISAYFRYESLLLLQMETLRHDEKLNEMINKVDDLSELATFVDQPMGMMKQLYSLEMITRRALVVVKQMVNDL